MGQVLGFQRLQITSNQIVDLQSIRDDNAADPEFHAFITLGDDNGEKGLYMIVKILNPTALSVITYHINHDSGRPGSVLFETAWTARASLKYVRYDKIIKEFFYARYIMTVELRRILNEVKTIPPPEIELEKLRLLNTLISAVEAQTKMLAIIYEMDSIQDNLKC